VLDIGVTKLAIIGGIALVVIGPERLPGLARTIGTMLGRAQRYVADVKAEVGRSMELDELKKMKDTVESAARDVEQSVQTSAAEFEKSWDSASQGLGGTESGALYTPAPPQYRHPKKHWRVKQGATPQWFKARTGMRTKALSGAARVARFRPKKMG
jgi:sec-independent protein translocase protein TatB